MGSIPLVALGVHAPDPLQQAQGSMALRNLGQQTQQQAALAPGQLQQQQQQLQLGNQAIQQQQVLSKQQQLALQDQMTLRQIAPKYLQKDSQGNTTGYDMNGLVQDAESKGVNPATLQQLEISHAQAVKGLADADQTVRNNEIAKNKSAYEVLEGLKALSDPQQQAAAYPGAVAQLQKIGIDTSKYPTTFPGADGLNTFEATLGMHQQALDDAKKVADINKSTSDAYKEIPGTGMLFNPVTNDTKTPAGAILSPSMMQGKYVQIQQAMKLGQPVSPEDKAFLSSFEKMKTLVPAFSFNLGAGGVPLSGAPAAVASGKTGPAVAAAVPMNLKPTVMAVLEGRQSPPGSFALKTPYWQNVMNNVYAIDPQWNEQRAELRKNLTVGPQSKEVNAINTALAHAGILGDAIDSLGNSNMQVWNKIANEAGIQVGKDPVTTFNTIIHRFAPELATAYGQTTEGGQNKVEGDFEAKLGPSQLKNNLSETIHLLRGKVGAFENQWDQNKSDSMPSFKDRFIMPSAQAVLDKWAPEGGAQGGGQTQAGAPSTHMPGGKATGLTEGATGTGSDGKKYIVKGGIWQPVQ